MSHTLAAFRQRCCAEAKERRDDALGRYAADGKDADAAAAGVADEIIKGIGAIDVHAWLAERNAA